MLAKTSSVVDLGQVWWRTGAVSPHCSQVGLLSSSLAMTEVGTHNGTQAQSTERELEVALDIVALCVLTKSLTSVTTHCLLLTWLQPATANTYVLRNDLLSQDLSDPGSQSPREGQSHRAR